MTNLLQQNSETRGALHKINIGGPTTIHPEGSDVSSMAGMSMYRYPVSAFTKILLRAVSEA
jgi:hypothetical protein